MMMKISVLLLLDLSAAFDTTNHEILLSHLEHDFDICSTPLNWCRYYLSDRKQHVLVDGQIDRNIFRLRCFSRLCYGPRAVHSEYKTTYGSHWTTLYLS